MGTDISFFVERKADDEWVTCDEWAYGQGGMYEDLVMDVVGGSAFYGDRNYDLFAMLANVRNGYGAAGVVTGEGFNFISEPRGLPDDLCFEIADLASWTFEKDYQTASWLTLRELLDFNWDQTTTKRGMVNGPEYADWIKSGNKAEGGPSSYCGLAMGRETTYVEEDKMIELIKKIKSDTEPSNRVAEIEKQLERTFCQVSWPVSYSERAGYFLNNTIPRMQSLGKPEAVRCVFWFD